MQNRRSNIGCNECGCVFDKQGRFILLKLNDIKKLDKSGIASFRPFPFPPEHMLIEFGNDYWVHSNQLSHLDNDIRRICSICLVKLIFKKTPEDAKVAVWQLSKQCSFNPLLDFTDHFRLIMPRTQEESTQLHNDHAAIMKDPSNWKKVTHRYSIGVDVMAISLERFFAAGEKESDGLQNLYQQYNYWKSNLVVGAQIREQHLISILNAAAYIIDRAQIGRKFSDKSWMDESKTFIAPIINSEKGDEFISLYHKALKGEIPDKELLIYCFENLKATSKSHDQLCKDLAQLLKPFRTFLDPQPKDEPECLKRHTKAIKSRLQRHFS